MTRTIAAAAALLLLWGGTAFAAEENHASADETAKVAEAIAKIGCKAEDVEKESARLFEVDDAQCEIGQYDIKLDNDYSIISLTRDE